MLLTFIIFFLIYKPKIQNNLTPNIELFNKMTKDFLSIKRSNIQISKTWGFFCYTIRIVNEWSCSIRCSLSLLVLENEIKVYISSKDTWQSPKPSLSFPDNFSNSQFVLIWYTFTWWIMRRRITIHMYTVMWILSSWSQSLWYNYFVNID